MQPGFFESLFQAAFGGLAGVALGCIAALPVGGVAVWGVGRMWNRAWGSGGGGTFRLLVLLASAAVFLLTCLWVGTVELRSYMEQEGNRHAVRLSWEIVHRAEAESKRSGPVPILLYLANHTMAANDVLGSHIRVEKSDFDQSHPAWEPVRLNIQGRPKTRSGQDDAFYEDVCELCSQARHRCASRLFSKDLAKVQSSLPWVLLLVGGLLFCVVSVSAVAGIRMVPPAYGPRKSARSRAASV